MTTITTLTQQLAGYKAGFLQRATHERAATMAGATADLKATGIESRALQVGAAAPDITLPDALSALRHHVRARFIEVSIFCDEIFPFALSPSTSLRTGLSKGTRGLRQAQPERCNEFRKGQ